MAVSFAVGIPNVREYADPHVLVELAVAAEAAGWDGVFLWDHIAREEDPAIPATDPWIALAAIAARTQRVRLGMMVTPLPRRRPWKVARETVALDVLSGGRFTLGVGLGGGAQNEFAAFGEEVDARGRADLLDEGLAILEGLWSGAPFSHEGERMTVRDAQFLPRPVQEPRIPVWVAGRWPNRRPFRRAARWDGMFPIFDGVGESAPPPPGELAEAVRYTLAHRAGRRAVRRRDRGRVGGGRRRARSRPTPRPGSPGGWRSWAGSAGRSRRCARGWTRGPRRRRV